MKLYKVFFKNNKSVYATSVYAINNIELVNVATINDKKFIEWLVVNSDNEIEAIANANKILDKFRDALLS